MEVWKKCSSCKKPIHFKEMYWVCNVSTCNRKRTALSFCSVECWDAHLAVVRHRETWAVEKTAPTKELWEMVLRGEAELEPKEEKKEEVPKPEGGPKVILRRPSKA